MELFEVIREFGPSLGVIMFFMGRDAAREERLVKEISTLNTFIQTELIKLVKETSNEKQP
jgi:hypothetical protein